MAYPEPIPDLTGKQAKEFWKRLDNFKLTKKQKDFYKGARAYYLRMEAKDQTVYECAKCGRKSFFGKFGYHAPSKDSIKMCKGKVRKVKWKDAF